MKKKVTELILRDEGQHIKSLKENEFQFGQRPNRSKIGKYSSAEYAFKKNLKNPLAGLGNVDLELTGATNRSLFIKQRSGAFVFDANTPQWGYNINRYGSDIESINQKDFDKVQAQYQAPKLARFINEQLQIQ